MSSSETSLGGPEPLPPDQRTPGADEPPVGAEAAAGTWIGRCDPRLGREQGCRAPRLHRHVHQRLGIPRLLEGKELLAVANPQWTVARGRPEPADRSDHDLIGSLAEQDEPEAEGLLDERLL